MFPFPFFKGNGCGNDFVLLDNRDGGVSLDESTIRLLCDRRRGVGADGLIVLGENLSMSFFNCDGTRARLCANGTRCCAAFVRRLTGATHAVLQTDAGAIETDCLADGSVMIAMPEPRDRVAGVTLAGVEVHCVDTGVPHAVVFVGDVDAVDVRALGQQIRWQTHANVNFVQVVDDSTLRVRTFERGVEDETLACGTGVTASAIVFRAPSDVLRSVRVQTRGGDLTVDFAPLRLTGAAEVTFQGSFL